MIVKPDVEDALKPKISGEHSEKLPKNEKI